MDEKRRKSGMLIPTIVLGVLAIILIFIGYRQGESQHVSGLRAALGMTLEILPLLVFASAKGV